MADGGRLSTVCLEEAGEQLMVLRIGVVTGMSCGVDSFYTLHCYGSDDAPEGTKLTHLAHYDLERHYPFLRPPYDIDAILERKSRFHKMLIQKSLRVAEGKGLPLCVMHSNLDRDYYRGGMIYTGMYRFLACTLAMERLYCVYIDSSSGEVAEKEEPSLLKPTQRYEKLICKACRTEKLRYVVSDTVPRTKKKKQLRTMPRYKGACPSVLTLEIWEETACAAMAA